jgi:hypothetical protein
MLREIYGFFSGTKSEIVYDKTDKFTNLQGIFGRVAMHEYQDLDVARRPRLVIWSVLKYSTPGVNDVTQNLRPRNSNLL